MTKIKTPMDMQVPPYLKKGDRIRIVAPAKKLPAGALDHTVKLLEKAGYEVMVGTHAFKQDGCFAGYDIQRLHDLQEALDDPVCRCILMARGGYGSVRIIDMLDFGKFRDKPKWIVGYSDITYFHNHLNLHFNTATIHGTMPLDVKPEPERENSLALLLGHLRGNIKFPEKLSHKPRLEGKASGRLTGGNLAILHGHLAALGVDHFQDCILFIEDIGEELYELDRMLHNLKRAGLFKAVNGVIAGGFTNTKDTNQWFPGKDANSLIYELLKDTGKPACFNFPAGHLAYNYPLVFGKTVELEVGKKVSLNYADG